MLRELSVSRCCAASLSFFSSSSSSLRLLVTTPVWVWILGSWCQCLYTPFSSSQGLRWFHFRSNPFLIVGAVGGAAWLLLAASYCPSSLNHNSNNDFVSRLSSCLSMVPKESVFITACGWGLYSALAVHRYGEHRPLWAQHVLPLFVPMLGLWGWLFHIDRSIAASGR